MPYSSVVANIDGGGGAFPPNTYSSTRCRSSVGNFVYVLYSSATSNIDGECCVIEDTNGEGCGVFPLNIPDAVSIGVNDVGGLFGMRFRLVRLLLFLLVGLGFLLP